MPVRRSTGKPVPSGILKRIIKNRNERKSKLREINSKQEFKKWAESPEGKKVIAKANAETKKIIERLKKANTFDRADLENLKRRFNI